MGIVPINQALMQPVLIFGVERRLFIVNALIAFQLVAATRLSFPAAFVGLAFFIVLHIVLKILTARDPHFAALIKRSTRYSLPPFFSARSDARYQSRHRVSTLPRGVYAR